MTDTKAPSERAMKAAEELAVLNVAHPNTVSFGRDEVARLQYVDTFKSNYAAIIDKHMPAYDELLAACAMEVEWFDNHMATFHPDDTKLREVVMHTHGARIDKIRTTLSKANANA